MGPPQGEALLQGKSLICMVPFNGGCLFQAVSPSRVCPSLQVVSISRFRVPSLGEAQGLYSTLFHSLSVSLLIQVPNGMESIKDKAG